MRRLIFVLLASMCFPACCHTPVPPAPACEAVKDAVPLCGFRNPEDIERLPDNHSLLVSQMGDMEGDTPGSLAVYDTVDQTLSVVFPVKQERTAVGTDWGADTCPGIPDGRFAPHGISLRQRADGRWQVAVINHGGRESVEMFELLQAGDDMQLAWRGCVVPPDGIWMNDLALLRNGGFVASHMFDRHGYRIGGMRTGMWKAFLGLDTGYVFEWQPQQSGIRVLAGSEGSFPNGVAITPDDQTVYAAMCTAGALRELDRTTGALRRQFDVPQPDNLAWDDQGHLLVTGVTASLSEQMACSKHHGEVCLARFGVFRLDSQRGHLETVFEQDGAPMGAGTVARQLGENLYIGSYTGDRILRVPYVPSSSAVSH